MKRFTFLSLVLVVVIGLTTAGILWAQSSVYYSEEDVEVKVNKVDKGIQITVTSDDPEIAKDIKARYRWYRDIFKRAVLKHTTSACPGMGEGMMGGGMMDMMGRGMMDRETDR